MQEQSTKVKIFGIGLNKTGTSTLGKCGSILGYRHMRGNKLQLLEDVVLRRDFTSVKEVVSQYDLFEDWPWPLIYRELDQMFPGSKFILTVRTNEQVWLKSLKRHSMSTPPFKHYRKLAYGHNFPQWREKEHKALYRQHNSQVRAYFANRESDFLEICWELGDGFEKLCQFLGQEVPKESLPHANKGAERQVKKLRYLTNRILSLSGF